MVALHIDSVTMAYGRRLLFEAVSVHLSDGEILTVTGQNGSGKSTFLKIIAGLARPESGTVRRVGFDALGYAAPDVQLYAELTGNENLDFFARLRGVPLGQGPTLLPQVGLPAARGLDRVGEYSSGMRQRLKLAVSLLGNPPLLLWDEPTATLDEAGKQCVDELLTAHRRRGGLAVVATNDTGEAARWGTQRLRIGV